MNETDEQIKSRLTDIFANDDIAAKITHLVVHKKPLGWGKKSQATYYKEHYALWMKKYIDLHIENGKGDLTFRYSEFCNDRTGMSYQTLYNRIDQSTRYLCEQMDPDGRYNKWKHLTTRNRKRGVGIVISYEPGFEPDVSFKIQPQLTASRADMPIWKRQLDEWMESDSMLPFCKEGLALSPDEILSLKAEFAQISSMSVSITSIHVKVIKLG